MADAAESQALAGLTVEAFAGYVDGGIGDQPNSARITAAHPSAHHLSIALSAAHDADCLDVEFRAASPDDVPPWITRQQLRGVARPVVYASVSLMKAEILPRISGWRPGSVRLWTAHYGLGEHICGPKTCEQLPVDADATQWTDAYHGPSGVVDMSCLRDDFFSSPADWVFSAVRGLTAVAGHHSVLLSWSAPGIAAPGAVHHYQVVVQHEGATVPSYPRDVPKGNNPQSWQGGGLTPATAYTAMVRAMTADNGHASPWAAVTFTTGHV